MIIVNIKGMDVFHIISKTKELHPALVSLYKVKEDDLLFYAQEGFVVHDGIEQTSFVLFVYIEADEKYKNKEKDVMRVIKNILSDTAIHFYFKFTYKKEDEEYLIKDEKYPLYMTDENVVKAHQEHDSDEEPYLGNVISEYENYIDSHPNASADELYSALMNINHKDKK